VKAIIRDAYGSVDVLRLADIDQPVAGKADVLVRVQAAGIDQACGT
jgi:NADPH:quinone reductase-like Zn-dependent oxidoreductase